MPDIQEPKWRCKNKAGNLMARVHKHAKGEIEMTNSQLKAAEIYLRKTIPDLSRVDQETKHSGHMTFGWKQGE